MAFGWDLWQPKHCILGAVGAAGAAVCRILCAWDELFTLQLFIILLVSGAAAAAAEKVVESSIWIHIFFYSPRSFLFLRVLPGEKLALNMQIQQICSVNTELCFIFIFDLNYDWEVEKSITPTTATTRGTLKFLIYFRISWNLHIGLWIFFFSTELKK